MASAFGHAFSAIAIGSGFTRQARTGKFILLGIFCSILPDADVISFAFGIPYESMWGHRGFTHSIVIAIILAVVITMIFYRHKFFSKEGFHYILYFAMCAVSHGLLDAMTNGGLGVAFFAPFDNSRYFLPFRPIRVSPIGVSNFFGSWGLEVLKSELIWIGVPGVFFLILMKIRRNRKVNKR